MNSFNFRRIWLQYRWELANGIGLVIFMAAMFAGASAVATALKALH